MSLLFDGSFANPTTPLWLSAYTPTPGPNNLQVSTLTVNSAGGIIMTSDGFPLPGTAGASVAFNRLDNASLSATELFQVPSKNVPTKTVETTYLASATNGGTVYDDFALNGLQIYGPQLTNTSANSGCAGYLTQGTLPFSVKLNTGQFQTASVHADVGYFSTLFVSTGNAVITDPLNISTLNASTINSGHAFISSLSSQMAYISSLRTQEIVTSTLVVSSLTIVTETVISSFTVSTLNALNANIQNASTGILTAGIGTFSTLFSPGFSVTSSTITAGEVSTLTGFIKEVFLSTMQFNATLSPNLDLGLGGVIGGLLGGFGANALSVGLGAGGLATGIASLVMSRQSGGINPSVFQTINGTSQLQFSTLGAVTQTIFVDTNSLNPTTTPGTPVFNSSYIPAGTYCMRTVSDPLNLGNASGALGDGIQGFSQWVPVYPGYAQVQSNALTSILTGNSFSVGQSLGDSMYIRPAAGKSLFLNERVIVTSSLTVQGPVNATSVVSPSITGSVGSLSTLNVSTFAIGNVQYQNFTASTITASTITASTMNTYNLNASGTIVYNQLAGLPGASITVSQLNASGGVLTNQLTVQGSAIITQTASVSALLGISSINGAPYTGGLTTNPTISTLTVGTGINLATPAYIQLPYTVGTISPGGTINTAAALCAMPPQNISTGINSYNFNSTRPVWAKTAQVTLVAGPRLTNFPTTPYPFIQPLNAFINDSVGYNDTQAFRMNMYAYTPNDVQTLPVVAQVAFFA